MESNNGTGITPIEHGSELALDAGSENYLNPVRFDQIHRLAKVFAASDMVPPHFKKVENSFIALQSAFRAKIDPMVALQNMFIVQGRPGTSAALAIALANRSGVFKGPIRYMEEGSGDSYAVTAIGIIKATGEETKMTASMEMARKENWTKNPKYQSMPSVMLRYRAATLLIRNTIPEALFGMETVDELEDVEAAKRPLTDSERKERFEAATAVVDAPHPEKKPRKQLKPTEIVDVNKPAQEQAQGTTKVQTPYDVIDQCIERNGLKPEVVASLRELSTRDLRDQDRMLLPELIRWANTGKPEQLDKLIAARPKLSTGQNPELSTGKSGSEITDADIPF